MPTTTKVHLIPPIYIHTYITYISGCCGPAGLTPSSLETTNYHTSDKMKGTLLAGGTSTSILFRPALGSGYDDHLQQQEAATNNIQTPRLSLINFRNNGSGRLANYIDRSLLSFAQDKYRCVSEHLITSCSFESSGTATATAFGDPNTSCSTNIETDHVEPAAGEWFCSDDVVFPEPGIQLPNSLKRPNHTCTGDNSSQIAKKQCSSTSTSTIKQLAKQKSSGASKDPQSIAAKNRRERISERLKMLQDLVPNGSKVDLVTMLEKAISYVKFLQLQVKVLATDEFWPAAQGGKAPDISQVKEAIDAILLSSQTQRDRRNSCTATN